MSDRNCSTRTSKKPRKSAPVITLFPRSEGRALHDELSSLARCLRAGVESRRGSFGFNMDGIRATLVRGSERLAALRVTDPKTHAAAERAWHAAAADYDALIEFDRRPIAPVVVLSSVRERRAAR